VRAGGWATLSSLVEEEGTSLLVVLVPDSRLCELEALARELLCGGSLVTRSEFNRSVDRSLLVAWLVATLSLVSRSRVAKGLVRELCAV